MLIFFLVNLVGVRKASVFDHDEVHPDSLVYYSGYCLQIFLPICPSYQRGWVKTIVVLSSGTTHDLGTQCCALNKI